MLFSDRPLATEPPDVTFDPYRILGIERDAPEDEIRRVYRLLARQYHPDLNKTPGAEERFKELGQALAVLTDPEKRALFDRHGEAALKVGFDAGGQAPPQPQRPPAAPRRERDAIDLRVPLEIDLLTAITGGDLRATSPLTGAPLSVQVPPGSATGDQICLPGRGRPGRGGPPGDLCFEIVVQPHPFFHLEGLDLVLELPLTIDEAHHGARIQIPTLEGWARVRIPAGSRGGERLRLRGRGLQNHSGRRGDLHVHLCIRLPERLDALGRTLDRLEALYTTPVRQGLRL